MTQRVLVIGGGAREHALLWCLAKTSDCTLFSWPGNAGTSEVAINLELNPERLVPQIMGLKPDYVVIGPDEFLAQGLVDELAAVGIPAFGPNKEAAKIEWSKEFALEVMGQANIPRPESWILDNSEAVVTSAKRYGKPVVVKADGLGGGKHVWLCHDLEEVRSAANLCWEFHPGEPIVVQEMLEGKEVSVFVFTDGYHISPMVAACDYKRAYDGDQGPNTGGMGSYAWPRRWSKKLEQEILQWIIRPLLRTMVFSLGAPFKGMLYVGLMLTKDGFKVLEFNARPGDPESQVIFPLFEGDLLEVMQACTWGNLNQVQFSWNRRKHAVGVVMASQGYPGEYAHGYPISMDGVSKDSYVFHASTRRSEGALVTDDKSGRVLTVVGTGPTLAKAREAAYRQAETIAFENAMMRTDIASVA